MAPLLDQRVKDRRRSVAFCPSPSRWRGPLPLPASGARSNTVFSLAPLRAGLSGENILAMLTCMILPENELKSSCADLIRVSTSLSLPSQGVDAHGSSPWAEGPRDKPGQDEIGRRTPSLGRR